MMLVSPQNDLDQILHLGSLRLNNLLCGRLAIFSSPAARKHAGKTLFLRFPLRFSAPRSDGSLGLGENPTEAFVPELNNTCVLTCIRLRIELTDYASS